MKKYFYETVSPVKEPFKVEEVGYPYWTMAMHRISMLLQIIAISDAIQTKALPQKLINISQQPTLPWNASEC